MSGVFHAFVLTDPHVGNRLPHAVAGPDGVTDRLIDQLEALAWAFDYGAQEKLPVVCLGDLCDDHLVDTITLDLLAGLLRSRVPSRGFYVVPGNHDAHDQTNRFFSPMAMSRLTEAVQVLDDLHGIDTQQELPGREFIAALPFCAPSVAREFFAEQRDPKKLLLGHLEVNGFGHGGAWTCTGGLDENDIKGWGGVLSGHFHARQEFKQVRGMYIGALTQLKFDDMRKPQGGWRITWDGKDLSTEFVHYEKAPTFLRHDLNAAELTKLIQGADDNGTDPFERATYLKLVVTGTDEELVAVDWEWVRKALKKGGARQVIFDHRPISTSEKRRLDVDVGAPLEDLLAAYVNHPSVVTEGFDKDILLKVGVEALRYADETRRRKPVTTDGGGQ